MKNKGSTLILTNMCRGLGGEDDNDNDRQRRIARVTLTH